MLAGVGVRINPDARSSGCVIHFDAARARTEIAEGFSALMRHSIAWPRMWTSPWVMEAFPQGRSGICCFLGRLGDFLGDGVFDLDALVDFGRNSRCRRR